MSTQEESDWPPFRNLGRGSRSDLSAYRPEIAQAMKDQGMDTLAHLVDRIAWYRRSLGLKDLNHDGLSAIINTIVHPPKPDSRNFAFSRRFNSFSIYAECISVCLEKPLAALFPAEEKMRLAEEKARALQFYVLEERRMYASRIGDGSDSRQGHIDNLAQFNMTNMGIGIF